MDCVLLHPSQHNWGHAEILPLTSWEFYQTWDKCPPLSVCYHSLSNPKRQLGIIIFILAWIGWFVRVLLFSLCLNIFYQLGSVKRIWYLSPMRAAKVQASLRIRAVSPEPPLLAHTSSVSRGTFRQKARSLAPLNGWACAVKICHDGVLEDTNSLDGAQL